MTVEPQKAITPLLYRKSSAVGPLHNSQEPPALLDWCVTSKACEKQFRDSHLREDPLVITLVIQQVRSLMKDHYLFHPGPSQENSCIRCTPFFKLHIYISIAGDLNGKSVTCPHILSASKTRISLKTSKTPNKSKAASSMCGSCAFECHQHHLHELRPQGRGGGNPATCWRKTRDSFRHSA